MSNFTGGIKDYHLKNYSDKGKLANVITVKFIKSCKDYGFSRFNPPSRGDVKKAENVFKLIADAGVEITITELIEAFVAKWNEFNIEGIPDLGKIPLVYKILIPDAGYKEVKVEWED